MKQETSTCSHFCLLRSTIKLQEVSYGSLPQRYRRGHPPLFGRRVLKLHRHRRMPRVMFPADDTSDTATVMVDPPRRTQRTRRRREEGRPHRSKRDALKRDTEHHGVLYSERRAVYGWFCGVPAVAVAANRGSAQHPGAMGMRIFTSGADGETLF